MTGQGYAAVALASQAVGSSQSLPIVLPLEQQFRAALAQIHSRDETYEQSLLDRLRAGDRTARADLVTYLLPPLELFTRHYLATHYRQVMPRFEILDLVHEGVIALLEATDRADRANPCAYLLCVAQGAIRSLCHARQSAITLPNTDGAAPWPVLSLERPLHQENDNEPLTLLDLLATQPTETSSPDQETHRPLRDAVASLTALQQAVLTRRYGLDEQAQETWAEVAQALYGEVSTRAQKRCFALHAYALGILRHQLAAAYPQFGTAARPHQQRYAPTQRYAYEGIQVSETQRMRLDEAAARLNARGEKLSRTRLAREAGMSTGAVVSRYLSEREEPWQIVQQRERQRREDALAAAYGRLVARGEKINGNRLAREAGITNKAAKAFLQNPLLTTRGGQA